MKLRAQVALATTAVVVPLALGLAVGDRLSRQRAAEEALVHDVWPELTRPGARERCEAGESLERGPPPLPPPALVGPPPHEGGHRFPPGLSFFGPDGTPRLGGAQLAARELEALRRGEQVSRSSLGDEDHVALVERTPWGEGRCAFVLLEGSKEPWLGALVPSLYVWLVPSALVLLAVGLVIGPHQRRLERLTGAIRSSVKAGYAPVSHLSGSDEVADLAIAFDEASLEVRSQLASNARREAALRAFVADTMHDLMVPLSVLMGHLSRLRRGPSPASVGAAMNEVLYVGSLLQNLSLSARLESGPLQPQWGRCELGALAERVVERHRPVAEELGLSIELNGLDRELDVRADVTMLEQALSNLVHNALRHHRAGGHVAVLVTGDDERFCLTVLDDGPGVSEDALQQLTQRGFRGEARGRNEGQGLGLDICARVCALHGLELRFSRVEPTGLRVEMRGERTAERRSKGAPATVEA